VWHVPPAPVLEHKEAPRRDLDARSLSSVSSTNLEQSDSEVPGGRVKLWRVMVGMEQRDSTWRAIITRYWKGTDDGGKMKDKVLNSNSRRQGRTEKRTSFPRFSASRALRETKPRSKRRVSPRVRRAAEPHPQPRCIVHRASLRKGGTNSYHFFGKTTAMFENSQLEEEGVLSLSSIPFIARVKLPSVSISSATKVIG